MQIHVVQQGDTLYRIANLYGTTIDELVEVNELDTPNYLVVGQSLVVPIIGQWYVVQPGDSLYSIAQKFGIHQQQLAQMYQLPVNQMLPAGYTLYIPEQLKREITAQAYIEPYGENVSDTLVNAATKTAPYLTYIAPSSYRVSRDGTLTPPPLDNFRQIAAQNNTGMLLVVTNLEDEEFSKELGHIIVTVQAVQNTLLDNIVNVAKEQGFSGVHFDFEFLPPEDREAYNQFLRKTKQRLSEEGLSLSTALAPKTSAQQTGGWYEAHDYAAHGEIADFVVLMTYEWGYSYGPPLAVSPIDEVRKVINFALSVMPAEKILMGQNLYGYDWTLPYEEDGEPAEAISPQEAINRARIHHAAIRFDNESQAPFYHYYDEQGKKHEVWFEDARSIQAKFEMIMELGLRGISYWKLGLAFPQNWLLLQDRFRVRKLHK
ncbi:LysM peptidoglycan-binding domain-containing protein [Lentibacillus cibarius]|uniref:LysM peptidoglycan-binding domain-containing protein n=1 Tax=Lentibacillus cibarius TaxID=2583219 RepID=A0A549YGS0_9BACI|nr:glycoside hydrolase family 18 protein [Lentibacillus cibarius]TRM11083.1 LysM peptidoglycan-binding domain-containing protein [Lentibacillus cibarius]